ncbi:MAG: hypothetical protein DRG58_11175 [Deltaproteobacteria bacterium]|nr:MAG: hypothetical protein DRG58_11175 [Deltaproteobacteria bacterium]
MIGNLKEAGLQESVRTNRNCIRGIALWVSNHIFAKPVANKLSYVDAAEIDSRINDLPGETRLRRESAEAIVATRQW